MAIQIEFDKPRELKFNLAAIRDMEAALDGKPLAAIVGDITRLGINATVIALWAGLKHEDRALSVNLVTKMLETYIQKGGKAADGSVRSLRTLSGAVDRALEETGLFRNEDDDEGNGQTEQATT